MACVLLGRGIEASFCVWLTYGMWWSGRAWLLVCLIERVRGRRHLCVCGSGCKAHRPPPHNRPPPTHLHHVVDRVEAARARVVGEQPQELAVRLAPPQVVRVAGRAPVGPELVPDQGLGHEHLGGPLGAVDWVLWWWWGGGRGLRESIDPWNLRTCIFVCTSKGLRRTSMHPQPASSV